MQKDNFILIIAIVVVALALFNLTFNLTKFTGYVSDTGDVNLTVETATSINFSNSAINWGAGKVNVGETNATLDTEGSVDKGNWTTVTTGLIIENIGNINVSIDLKTGKNASSFIGGTGPGYSWKIQNNETDSCSHNETTLEDVYNTTSLTDIRACGNFSHEADNNQIVIDINITVPSDSLKGARTDTITATATASA
jgi:hypothetical protein